MIVQKNLGKELKEIIKKKKALFEEILKITELQKQWIQKEEWKRLNNTINSKQNKIEKINSLNHVLGKLLIDQDIKLYVENPALEEMNEIIYKIQLIENENADKVQSNMKNIKEELRNIQLKKKVNTAYSNVKSVQKDGYFLDRTK